MQKLKKAIGNICDWVYQNLDWFFQGPSAKPQEANRNDISRQCCNGSGVYSFEWEMNQGVVDIAINDIKCSFSWLMPGFLKEIVINGHRKLIHTMLLDSIIEEEFSDIEFDDSEISASNIGDSGKTSPSIQLYKERINEKVLSINDWLHGLFEKLKLYFIIESRQETFYLLGYFAPEGYDYITDNQNYMIRGPDKVNFTTAGSFHKRN